MNVDFVWTDMEGYKEECMNCSHRQCFDGKHRCCRFHAALCDKVYKFCEKKYYIDLEDGLSLYAMREWLKLRTKEEMELPFTVKYDNSKLYCHFIFRMWDGKDQWILRCKNK